jgi:hypothetical protein
MQERKDREQEEQHLQNQPDWRRTGQKHELTGDCCGRSEKRETQLSRQRELMRLILVVLRKVTVVMNQGLTLEMNLTLGLKTRS